MQGSGGCHFAASADAVEDARIITPRRALSIAAPCRPTRRQNSVCRLSVCRWGVGWLTVHVKPGLYPVPRLTVLVADLHRARQSQHSDALSAATALASAGGRWCTVLLWDHEMLPSAEVWFPWEPRSSSLVTMSTARQKKQSPYRCYKGGKCGGGGNVCVMQHADIMQRRTIICSRWRWLRARL